MTFDWLKGHGTENDFVLLPDHDGSVHGDLDASFVEQLCNRHRGLGGDGVLRVIRTSVVEPGSDSTSGWFMDYRNADGSISEMCGNGVRVFARHLFDEGLVVADQPVAIGTRAGDKTVTRVSNDEFVVDMGQAVVGDRSVVRVAGADFEAHDVSMGNPHAVVFVDDLAEAGALIEEPGYDHAVYPEGVNIEFVVRLGPGQLAMRVHERGAGETRSCGTGACAVAVASALREGAGRPASFRIDVPGGTVHATWAEDGQVSLRGPAAIVARGTMSWRGPDGLADRNEEQGNQ